MNTKYARICLTGLLMGCGTATDSAIEGDGDVGASAVSSVVPLAEGDRAFGTMDDSADQFRTMDLRYSGRATFYATTDKGGHCSFGSTGLTFFGAMNHADYAGSAACGACVDISSSNGSVQVRITNECPECARGDIDLSEQAFAKLAPISQGRIPISWTYVPCSDIKGPIVYHFKDGSNPYWAAIQIRNHVQPIAKLEVKQGSSFISLRRESYNYFIADNGLGSGPYTIRVTDTNGYVIKDSGIGLSPFWDVPSPSRSQFP